MFKKTAIAVAVAGACGASVSAQAMTVDAEGNHQVYGFVNVTGDFADTSNGGVGSNMFLPAGADSDFHLGDQANSRFGFRGSTDLGNGLTAGYRIEIGFGTSAFSRGSVKEDAEPWDKRLANVSLSGGFGSLKVGNQWGVLYEYLGWNDFRSHGFGGATYYETTGKINDDGFGLRVSDAVKYTYGSGGYGSDPFTFSVQGIFDQATEAGNDETLDAVTFGAAATFGNITINGAYYDENNDGAAEPSLAGVGFRANITDAFMLSGNFMTVDTDDGTADVDTAKLHAEFDFGNGLTSKAGFGVGSDDTDGDLTQIFLQLQKDLGQGTLVYSEFETASRDVAGPDPESTILAVGVKKSF